MGFNFLLSVSQVLIPLVTMPYITRALTPEGMGKVSFFDALSYYLVVIAEMGITIYGIRAVAAIKSNKALLRTTVSELLLLHIVFNLLIVVLYTIAAYFLWHNVEDERLFTFSLAFVLANCFTCEWYFYGTEDFKFISIRTLVIRLAGVACIFLLVKQPPDYYIYYAIIAFSGVATYVWNFITLLRREGFTLKGLNPIKHLRKLWVTWLISMVYSVPLFLDTVFLRMTSASVFVGYYATALKMVRTGTSVITDSFLVFFPRVVALSENKDSEQLREKLLYNLQFILLLAIPAGVGLFLLADDFTSVFFGTAFAPVVFNLKILALFPLLKSVSLYYSNPVLLARHKEKIFLKNLIASTGFFIVAAFVLSTRYNDTGMCIALLLAELLLIILNGIQIHKHFSDVPLMNVSIVYEAVGASLLFVPVIWAIQQILEPGVVRLIISIATCVLVFAASLWWLGRSALIVKAKQLLSKKQL